jgi:hypothetical protein
MSYPNLIILIDLSPYFETFMEPRNRFQGMNSAILCSLAGRYDNPIPPRFLAPIACLKIPALDPGQRCGSGLVFFFALLVESTMLAVMSGRFKSQFYFLFLCAWKRIALSNKAGFVLVFSLHLICTLSSVAKPKIFLTAPA